MYSLIVLLERCWMMKTIKEKLEAKQTIVVCDANVFLEIYSYSPGYCEYALSCLEAVKDYIVMPSMVEIEYTKHFQKMFRKMNNRINDARKSLLQQIDNANNNCMSTISNIERIGFSEIDELKDILSQQYELMSSKVEDFFDDRSQALELLSNSWGDEDHVFSLYENIKRKKNIMPGFSQSELYLLCEQGKKRYEKSIPPGYRDNDKDGLGKYGDYIWWKEVIRYSEINHCDVILVTDDVKEDWWHKNENGTREFRNELIKEFGRSKQNIEAYTTKQFYEIVKNEFNIDEPDIVQCVLNLTDDDYCKRISDRVFDLITEDLSYNGVKYISGSLSHDGDIGLDELEISSYEYIGGSQTAREMEDVYYVLEYKVEVSGYTYDFWGRDDDTKEFLYSPGNHHEFEGTIQVAVTRKADIFIDFENEESFESVELVDGNLSETSYKSWVEYDDDEERREGYDICPICGETIGLNNDAGNGFCVKCSQMHDD